MKANKPFVHIRHRGGGRWAALLAGLALLAWPTASTRADVIDDFEQGRKFLLAGRVDHSEWEIANGQFRGSLPTAQSYAAVCYSRSYELTEGQPVTMSVDAVSANRSDVYVFFGVSFAGRFRPKQPDRGYGLVVWHNRVELLKYWDDTFITVFDEDVASKTAPKTLSLTFTRQGPDLIVDAQVVLRDDPRTVVSSMNVTDTSESDIPDDPGPPPSGPTTFVIVGFQSSSPEPGAAVVLDNVVCSRDPVPPRLEIRRNGTTEATMAWPGRNIALESDSVLGPWRPCSEPMALGEGEYTSTVPLSGFGRYYRLVRGTHCFDSFDRDEKWKTTSVVPGGTRRPGWYPSPSQSRGRILGTGANNEDFTLRFDNSWWFTDCVGTVDIIDWGDAMEDATFGIVLRAQPKPEHDRWYCNTAGLPAERYAGLLTFNKGDNSAESALSITGQDGRVMEECRFPAVNPEKQYRLRFWAVGDQLKLELFNHDDLDTPIVTCTKSHEGIPAGMFALYGTRSAGGTYEVVIDQFMLSGATVY